MGKVRTPPVTRIPMGVRALPEKRPKSRRLIIKPEACGRGMKRIRSRHLDEIDGDNGNG